MTAPLSPEWIDLATDIRAVDGNHDLGASALAEALTARGWTRRQSDERLREALDWAMKRLDPFHHEPECTPVECVCGYWNARAALASHPEEAPNGDV